jgi:hypothetical protein
MTLIMYYAPHHINMIMAAHHINMIMAAHHILGKATGSSHAGHVDLVSVRADSMQEHLFYHLTIECGYGAQYMKYAAALSNIRLPQCSLLILIFWLQAIVVQIKGMCQICGDPVTNEHKRFSTGPGSYTHENCFKVIACAHAFLLRISVFGVKSVKAAT